MSKAFVQIASWEERFEAGFRAAFSADDMKTYVCLASNRYRDRTEHNLSLAVKLAQTKGIDSNIDYLDFSNVLETYNAINSLINKLAHHNINEFVFDVSTAPRHLIWGILSEASHRYESISIQYVKAQSYGDWQTDEDLDPRLVVNCSGIMLPDLPTCLVMLCGPDLIRAEKLFYKFEPRKTIILRDSDAEKFGSIRGFDYVEKDRFESYRIDNKDFSDENIKVVSELVIPLLGNYNIVCASFGPKLGAILLFQLIRRYPDIALAYVPAGIHNPDNSTGVSSLYNYKLVFDRN